MPRRPFNRLAEQRINAILGHTAPLPVEAGVPLQHYRRTATDSWNLLNYVSRNVQHAPIYQAVFAGHMARLRRMILLSLCAAFERFLKELAAVCVDHVASCVLDDRLDELTVESSALAAHFSTQTLGKAMCESSTWLDCDKVNVRFRKLLANPGSPGDFYVFPNPGTGQLPANERFRYAIMNTLWQLRHTLAHNDGVITISDALKFRLLIRSPVQDTRIVCPSNDDIGNALRFLSETAVSINSRVSPRLAALLTALHQGNPTLFDPLQEATTLAQALGVSVTIGGQTAGP